ncbi:choice-of-anchor B family protein [Patiriisocius hiemis]|uniref:Choice-of-anchor B family protein n=1 Tax=Patiriisocius hiemis TaxID=3075604 RepID=A0ABU2YDT5_9FLAO|nr:choice-of-anchor B family protein [Constantimarinum sp. W242]MDT0555415.1 choice-of-anchor B family protein [Constantimarinum sp. W242]
MKSKLYLLFITFSTILYAQTPCVGGGAAGFPCENYDLLSQITPGQMNASRANDSWGWTDPDSGIEYAIIGLDNGTAFIDISDPINPIYLGKLPTQTDPSTWRDIKVYSDHAFIVSEAFNHGMQVFDLTQLRNVTNPPVTFSNTAFYGEFGSAHNIVINEDTGFAYAVGTGTFNGGPHFIDITNPANPVAAGGFALDDYSHDAQVVTYSGPDADYTDQEIYIGSHGSFGSDDIISIVDVTNKSNPISIATLPYPNPGYAHQGWFTEDQRYFILGDETDEINIGFNTRTIIFDLTDLDAPQFLFEFFGPTPASDHNGYVVGDKYYFANYNRGMTVIDISDIANQNFSEYGFFDVHPSTNNVGTSGTWNVYPFFESGNIVISGTAGFTLVKDATVVLGASENDIDNFAIVPNPTSGNIAITSSNAEITKVEVYSMLGQQLLSENFIATNQKNMNVSSLSAGVYILKINNTTTKQIVVK